MILIFWFHKLFFRLVSSSPSTVFLPYLINIVVELNEGLIWINCFETLAARCDENQGRINRSKKNRPWRIWVQLSHCFQKLMWVSLLLSCSKAHNVDVCCLCCLVSLISRPDVKKNCLHPWTTIFLLSSSSFFDCLTDWLLFCFCFCFVLFFVFLF